MALARFSPNPSTPSVSTDGTPLAIGTSATTVHVPPSAYADDIVLTLVNSSAADVSVTIAYGGVSLTQLVPTYGSIAIGPWTMVGGTLTVAAASGGAIRAIASIRR